MLVPFIIWHKKDGFRRKVYTTLRGFVTLEKDEYIEWQASYNVIHKQLQLTQEESEEAGKHWRSCEAGWNRTIKQAEGFLKEKEELEGRLVERRAAIVRASVLHEEREHYLEWELRNLEKDVDALQQDVDMTNKERQVAEKLVEELLTFITGIKIGFRKLGFIGSADDVEKFLALVKAYQRNIK